MSNLMASMATAGNALDVYQQALTVVQNNITNSSTPGYATQSLNMVAQPLDVAAVSPVEWPRKASRARAMSTRKMRFAVNCSPWGHTKARVPDSLPSIVCSM